MSEDRRMLRRQRNKYKEIAFEGGVHLEGEGWTTVLVKGEVVVRGGSFVFMVGIVVVV